MVRVKKAGIGTTVDAVNCRTGATDDPAKFVLMVIEVKEKEPGGWFPVEITPDDTPADATQSVSVCTVMPVALPAVAAPIVMPLRVMVTNIGGIPAPPVVMMIRLFGANAVVADIMGTDDAEKTGVAVGEKKSDG
jgi:hypothetical protein